MSRIHPTACIDPQAQLADDVEIGPFCVVEGKVTLGPGCRLISHVCLKGPMVLGSDNVFYPFACLGFEPQDHKFDMSKLDPALPGVVGGDHNIFREGATVHRSTLNRPTTLGHSLMMMANSHVAHDCTVGNHVTMVNGSLIGGHVHLADQVTLGGSASIHQYCRIGRLAMVSGSIGITQDVPPFTTSYTMRTISSLNYVGLRRSGSRAHIKNLQRAFHLLFLSRHTNQRGVELVLAELGHDPLCVEMASFVATSKRGICPCTFRGQGAELPCAI